MKPSLSGSSTPTTAIATPTGDRQEPDGSHVYVTEHSVRKDSVHHGARHPVSVATTVGVATVSPVVLVIAIGATVSIVIATRIHRKLP